jgi:hypothetical protein
MGLANSRRIYQSVKLEMCGVVLGRGMTRPQIKPSSWFEVGEDALMTDSCISCSLPGMIRSRMLNTLVVRLDPERDHTFLTLKGPGLGPDAANLWHIPSHRSALLTGSGKKGAAAWREISTGICQSLGKGVIFREISPRKLGPWEHTAAWRIT